MSRSDLAIEPAADAIVVLGGRLTPAGECGPGLARRVSCGVRLFQASRAPLLVMSGRGAGHCSEASAMCRMALEAGVPSAALLAEDRSMNTIENAREVAILLRARKLDGIVLVTDAYHLPRARFLFRRAGLRVVASIASHRHPPHKALLYGVREFAAWLRGLALGGRAPA